MVLGNKHTPPVDECKLCRGGGGGVESPCRGGLMCVKCIVLGRWKVRNEGKSVHKLQKNARMIIIMRECRPRPLRCAGIWRRDETRVIT